VNLINDEPVSGVQLILSDIPDVLSYVEVLPTDRTKEFTISAAEGESGVTILGFSFTGAVIAEGDGPIVEVIYNLGMVEFDTDVEVTLSGSILSDPAGNGIDHDVSSGTFMVYASELMAPETPENLTAEGGQNSVSLSWDTSWQAAQYEVYRDGNVIAEVTSTSYSDNGLDNEATYCYLVTASNSEGQSDPSNEACATTLPEYTGPPIISLGSASINAGDSFDIEVSLANPSTPVAGVQIQILDIPDHLDANNVVGTDRLDGFELSWNSQADGSVLFIAFSLSGDTITPGGGPIAVISYQSTTPYEASIELDLVDQGTLLADGNGLPIEYLPENGSVLVSGKYSIGKPLPSAKRVP
jgi:hypothetical protein